MELNEENRREFYRVRYPIACRPDMAIGRDKYKVIDLSENGIKVLHENSPDLQPGNVVNAEICFFDKETLVIEGEVLRVNQRFGVAIIDVKQSIPLGRIMREQQFIMGKYPDFLKK